MRRFRSMSTLLAGIVCLAATVWLSGAAQAQTPPASKGPAAATPATPGLSASPSNPAQPAVKAPAPPSATAPTPSATPAAPPAAETPPLLPDAKAAGIPVEELVRPVSNLAADIDQAEKSLEQFPGSQSNLVTLRAQIEKLTNNAKSVAESLQPRLEEVRSQIAKLGPAPAADGPPEAEDVAAERQRLNAIAAQIDGAIKKAALIEVRARQLVSRVQHARQGVFTRFLFRQTDTPLQLRVWSQAADQLPLARRQLGFVLSNWLTVARLNPWGLAALIGGALLVGLGLALLVRRIMVSQLDAGGPPSPSRAERAATAVWVTPALALPAVAALGILYLGLDELGLLFWQVERLAHAAVFPVLVMIGISTFAQALLQPRRPRWRLFDIDDTAARTVCRAIQAITVVYAIDTVVRRIISILALHPSASIITAFIASLFYAGLLYVIARTPITSRSALAQGPVRRWKPYWLKGSLLLLAALLVSMSLLGYMALGPYIVTQLLTTGAGILAVGVFHIAIRAFVPEPRERSGGVNAIIEQRFSLDSFGRVQLARVQRWLLNILLFTVATPLLLLSWGLSGTDIVSRIRLAIFGFEIGGIHISLARIAAALALFALLLGATRFLQRWLAAGALAQGRMEAGLANSIYTGAGYIGFAVAALVAISYAGFDITSLAIVAGALSVGLGFGLQSIVNNFVSGLILLVERPIKVGDRVTVNGQEGFVRRISVRSTEIETFDRASLIVPNAEFITATVTNWTHRNALGRALVKVSAHYDADPEQVLEILTRIAGECPLVQMHPPPWAGFDNFGADGLEFLLIATVADINKVGDARSDLRVRVLKAFREAGIEIPFPQRDLHVRDIERIRTLGAVGREAKAEDERQDTSRDVHASAALRNEDRN